MWTKVASFDDNRILFKFDLNLCLILRLFSEVDPTGSSPRRGSGGNKEHGHWVGEAGTQLMPFQHMTEWRCSASTSFIEECYKCAMPFNTGIVITEVLLYLNILYFLSFHKKLIKKKKTSYAFFCRSVVLWVIVVLLYCDWHSFFRAARPEISLADTVLINHLTLWFIVHSTQHLDCSTYKSNYSRCAQNHYIVQASETTTVHLLCCWQLKQAT